MTIIVIESDQYPIPLLENALRRDLSSEDVRLHIERSRAFETTVLVAIVGAVGSALGSLLTGLLKLASEKGTKTITIHGKSGRHIEVPADTPLERIDELVDIAKDLDVDKISI